MRWLLAALACLAATVAATGNKPAVSDAVIASAANPPLLSAFGFFEGGPRHPAAGLIAYDLRTPLFSDYAEKYRFIHLPKGAKLSVDAQGRVQFPIGTALIKNFGYAAENGGFRTIETRLLLHRAEGWVALPYVWRADGSDAELKQGGARVPAAFRKANGSAMQISYAVPNKNQCKQCHVTGDKIVPIGPVWSSLVIADPQRKLAFANAASGNAKTLGAASAWTDKAASLDARAKAYLKINCGHCHKPSGSASNSGLFYDDHPGGAAVALGIGKRPVAAGRGAGNFDFVIDPGHPERSILIHRMNSTDPGVAMPELGRATAHDEGVKLLEDWIRAMKP
jgi:uncharacterized repeat protein (TIGR03806 family)